MTADYYVMSFVENLSADQKRAYDLIITEDGILQSDLWKELDANILSDRTIDNFAHPTWGGQNYRDFCPTV